MSRCLALLLPVVLSGFASTACVLDTSLTGLDKGEAAGEDTDLDGVDDTASEDDTAGGGGSGEGTGNGEGGEEDPAGRIRTAGTELWLAYMENLTLAFNGPPAFTVVIEAPEGAVGSIDVPVTGYTQAFELAAGEIAEIALPDAIWYTEGSDKVGIAGVRVLADRPVEAVGVHYRVYFSEASRLLPLEELGTEYRVLAVPDLYDYSPSSFVVVATADGTEVEVTPSVFTLGLRGAETPYTVTLNAGETWQVQAMGDLSGSRVRSLTGEPLAVFAGSREAFVGCGETANSHTWDQLLPIKRWGRHTVVVAAEPKGSDVVRVLAHEDDTEVRLDCGEPQVLQAGEVLETRVSGGVEVTASKPVLVGQVLESGGCDGSTAYGTAGVVGDPNFIVLPPAPFTREAATLRSLDGVSTLVDAKHYVALWSPEGRLLEVDGSPVDAGTTKLTAGDHTVTGDAPFQGIAYGLAPFEAYTYSLGYDCTGCLELLDEVPECD